MFFGVAYGRVRVCFVLFAHIFFLLTFLFALGDVVVILVFVPVVSVLSTIGYVLATELQLALPPRIYASV